MDDYSDKPMPRFHGRLLQNKQVSVGDSFKIQGDVELQREVEHRLEMMVREQLNEAKQQAQKIIAQAQAEADQAIVEARQQAEAIVAEASGQQENITKQAFEEGFQAGHREGQEDAMDQVEAETLELLESAQALVAHAYQAQTKVLKQINNDALALVQHVARKVIGRELETDSETILGMIHQSLESLHLSGKIRVVVSSELLQIIRGFTPKTQTAIDTLERIELVPDTKLSRYQIFVLSPEASFELSPDVQLETLTAPLANIIDLPMVQPEEIPVELLPGDEVEIANADTTELAEAEQLPDTMMAQEPETDELEATILLTEETDDGMGNELIQDEPNGS